MSKVEIALAIVIVIVMLLDSHRDKTIKALQKRVRVLEGESKWSSA